MVLIVVAMMTWLPFVTTRRYAEDRWDEVMARLTELANERAEAQDEHSAAHGAAAGGGSGGLPTMAAVAAAAQAQELQAEV